MMTSPNLLRWSGIAAAVAGLLALITAFIFTVAFAAMSTAGAAATPLWLASVLAALFGAFLSLLALFGLFAVQSGQFGVPGTAAFVLAALGTVLYAGYMWAGSFIVPPLSEAAPAFLDAVDASPSGLVAAGFMSTFILYALGWTLFSAVSLRAGLLPKIPLWLLIVGAIYGLAAIIAGLPLGSALFGLALAWLGWWLWAEGSAIGADEKEHSPAGAV